MGVKYPINENNPLYIELVWHKYYNTLILNYQYKILNSYFVAPYTKYASFANHITDRAVPLPYRIDKKGSLWEGAVADKRLREIDVLLSAARMCRHSPSVSLRLPPSSRRKA